MMMLEFRAQNEILSACLCVRCVRSCAFLMRDLCYSIALQSLLQCLCTNRRAELLPVLPSLSAAFLQNSVSSYFRHERHERHLTCAV